MIELLEHASLVQVILVVLYAMLALVASTNLLLMRRAGPVFTRESGVTALVPARDEQDNLKILLPELVSQCETLVFDDESEDGTAEVAARLGASVIRASEPLPPGWVGKNRACCELALTALRRPSVNWLLFLDADVRLQPGFVASLVRLARQHEEQPVVVTGFPRFLPGESVEPLALAWVGWILLSTNPFGLISRSRIGHCRMTNGQVQLWPADLYRQIMPHATVRNKILEDIEIGRLLCRSKVPVEVANLSQVLSVRMYKTWQEAFDGLSKNSFEIMGSYVGSACIALLLFLAGWGWLLCGRWWWAALGLLAFNAVVVARTVRACWWPALLAPLIPTVGAATVVRSMIWKARGHTRWKGRVYS